MKIPIKSQITNTCSNYCIRGKIGIFTGLVFGIKIKLFQFRDLEEAAKGKEIYFAASINHIQEVEPDYGVC